MSYFSKQVKSRRLFILKHQTKFPVASVILAVITIQKCVRGFIVRLKNLIPWRQTVRKIKKHSPSLNLILLDKKNPLYLKFLVYVQHLRSHGIAAVEDVLEPFSVPLHYAPGIQAEIPTPAVPKYLTKTTPIIQTVSIGTLHKALEFPKVPKAEKTIQLLDEFEITIMNSNITSRLSEKTLLNSSSSAINEKITQNRVNTLVAEPILHDSRFRMLDYDNYCAVRIQAWIRMKQTKKWYHLQKHFLRQRAACYIQVWWKKMKQNRILSSRDPIVQSVIKIQRAWKGFMNKRIYFYYRDLIRLRENSDPALILRILNPTESFLVDTGSGTYIRLRLGGANFPPTVYYKIFTTMPITDINAFAPRDYANFRDNKIGYRRIENNGWRPLSFTSDDIIKKDPVYQETCKKKPAWHPSKLIRKEEVSKRKKEAKLKWMKNMYKLNKSGDISDAHVTIPEEFDITEPDDELLNWSESLDFDAYQQTWGTLATAGLGGIKDDCYEPINTGMTFRVETRQFTGGALEATRGIFTPLRPYTVEPN